MDFRGFDGKFVFECRFRDFPTKMIVVKFAFMSDGVFRGALFVLGSFSYCALDLLSVARFVSLIFDQSCSGHERA